MMNHEEILDIEEIQEPKELSDLSWIGRAITANTKQADLIKEFRDKEVEKIKACCDRKIENLQESNDYLTGQASVVMKCHDYSYANKDMRKYLMPGIGTFRFSVTRESVDASKWDADGEIKLLPEALTKTKITTTPDKKAILARLQTGAEVQGFSLKPKTEKFEFKSE